MSNNQYCSQCGESINPENNFCTNCGFKLNDSQDPNKKLLTSNKSGSIALLLCILFGVLGIHRFYVKKIGTGLLMLLTMGGLGIWLLVDIILIATNKFDDKHGNCLITINKPNSFKKILLVIGSLITTSVIYFAFFIYIIFYLTSGLVDVVNKQLSALKAGNYTLAYSYTSKDFQSATSLQQFEAFIDRFPALKNNSNTSFYKREIYNNRGTLKGTLTSENGAKTPIIYHLIKEDGSWKIYHIKAYRSGFDNHHNMILKDKNYQEQ